MHRALSNITYKTLDEDRRIVEGIASTPHSDRMGDIVESLGASYVLPLPFLLDHNHTKAIGSVLEASVSGKGIRFRAQVAKIDTPGAAKDLVDSGWQMIKNGLRRAVSIGFRPIEWKDIPASGNAPGGVRFTKWEWLELSAVSVPANADAQITGVKAAPRFNVRNYSLQEIALRAPIDHQPLNDRQRAAVEMMRERHIDRLEAAARRQRLGIPDEVAVVRLAGSVSRRAGAGKVVRL